MVSQATYYGRSLKRTVAASSVTPFHNERARLQVFDPTGTFALIFLPDARKHALGYYGTVMNISALSHTMFVYDASITLHATLPVGWWIDYFLTDNATAAGNWEIEAGLFAAGAVGGGSAPADATGGRDLGNILLAGRSHCLARCWKVEAKDGSQTLYLTEHDSNLTLFDGNTYTPTGGFDGSAQRDAEGLKPSDASTSGAITDAAISFDGLRVGKWRRARVTMYLVDWRVPFMGKIDKRVFELGRPSFDGERWSAPLLGLTHRLRRNVGDRWQVSCPAKLYSTTGRHPCNADKPSKTTSGVSVESVSVPRLVFDAVDADISGSLADGYFARGPLEWLTGANAGTESMVRGYSTADRTIQLAEPTKYDIQAGDTFDIAAGCNHKLGSGLPGDEDGDCIIVHANGDNFQGHPFMPGTNATIGGEEVSKA